MTERKFKQRMITVTDEDWKAVKAAAMKEEIPVTLWIRMMIKEKLRKK